MKRIYKVELIIATIIICLILGISIPRFMRVQISGAEQRIQSGLDTLFTALKAYANDHNTQLPFNLLRGNDITLPIAKSQDEYFQFLVDTGYLKPGEFTLMLDNIDLNRDEYRTQIYVQTKFAFEDEKNKTPLIHNIGISIVNPNYDHIAKGIDVPVYAYSFYAKPVFQGDPNYRQTFQHPTGFYHISNGLRSFGIIYQDFLGNRSTNE